MNEYTYTAPRRSLSVLAITLALVGCADDSIRIDRADRVGFSTGDITLRRTTDRAPVAARAVVTEGDVVTTYEGEIASDGSVTIAGVPAGPYVLEIELPPDPAFPTEQGVRRSYPMTTRTARLGGDWWARAGVESAQSEDTAVSITATGLSPWEDGDPSDSIDLVSRRIDLVANIGSGLGLPGEPAAGDAEISGWTFALLETTRTFGDGVPLVDASRGDDLVLLHRRAEALAIEGSDDPWSLAVLERAIASAPVGGATFVDGATTEISAAFTPLPTTDYELDFRGSELAALAEALGLPGNARALATIALVSEPGEGPDYYVAATPTLWSISARSRDVLIDPLCVSDEFGECDFTCPAGCDATMRVHPGDLRTTIPAPDAFPDARDVLSVSYAFTVPWAHPTSMDTKTASFGASIYRRAVSGAPIGVVLSPPRNVVVDFQMLPLDAATDIAGPSPVVMWEAPEVGTAGHYVVQVIDLTTVRAADGSESGRRTVGSFTTLGTSLTIPAGTLVSGRYYQVRVTAHTYAWDDALMGQVHGEDLASAWTSTGALHAM